MTPGVLIVEWRTPDLLDLCCASLKRFAPEVSSLVLTGGPGPEWHARALEKARPLVLDLGLDPVILIDTDTVITSTRWWTVLAQAFTAGHDLVGGHRSRGDACQMFFGVTPLLHASMLAMRRSLFERAEMTAAPCDPELGCVTRDTGWRASLMATAPLVLPFHPVTHGTLFPGLQVGEYYEPTSGITLWSHLWRGTGMPAGGRVRQAVRRLRAACGSRGARTVRRAQERKEAWMRRAWEIVRA